MKIKSKISLFNFNLFLFFNIFFFFLYLIFTNILEAVKIFSIPESVFSTSFKIKLFFSTLFDYSYLLDFTNFILVLLSIISFSLLMTLFYIL